MGHLVEIEIVGDDLSGQRARQLNQLEVHFLDLGKVHVGDHHLDARHLLDLLQDVEAAAAAVALYRVRGVGDQLQFLEHELRNDHGSVDEAGLAQVRDAAVDDHGGVQDLVVTLGTGGAKQRDQARWLEPLALAAADDSADVGEHQQDKTVHEGNPLVAMIDPEQRLADALGQQQANGAAQERAEHVGDRGLAQHPLEGDRQQRQAAAQGNVAQQVSAKRLQQQG